MKTGHGDVSHGSDTLPGTAKLIEELGELQQVIGKLIATSGAEEHWEGTNLRHRLEEEIADVCGAIEFFKIMNGLDAQKIDARADAKLNQFVKWRLEQRSEPEVAESLRAAREQLVSTLLDAVRREVGRFRSTGPAVAVALGRYVPSREDWFWVKRRRTSAT
jgi:NTP pyrophosphatase (non-canonical NTP hydrolase)